MITSTSTTQTCSDKSTVKQASAEFLSHKNLTVTQHELLWQYNIILLLLKFLETAGDRRIKTVDQTILGSRNPCRASERDSTSQIKLLVVAEKM